jgi:hypothetical protein
MLHEGVDPPPVIYITYYLKAAALLLNALERQRVNSRPANCITIAAMCYFYLLPLNMCTTFTLCKSLKNAHNKFSHIS